MKEAFVKADVNADLDTLNKEILRAALIVACLDLTNGNMLEARKLAQIYYDLAPVLIDSMKTSNEKLPTGELRHFRRR